MDDINIIGAPRRGLRWLFPTRTALFRTIQLQRAVRSHEAESTTFVDDETVGRAAIHTREDLVLLIRWQEEHHHQLVNISRGVWIMGFLILMALGSR